MSMVTEILISTLLVISGVFGLIGSFGLLKLRDQMQRLHAPTKASTVGVGTALIATFFSTLAGISAVKWMQNWRMFRVEPAGPGETTTVAAAGPVAPEPELPPAPAPLSARGRVMIALLLAGAFGLWLWITVAPESHRAFTAAVHGALFDGKAPAAAAAGAEETALLGEGEVAARPPLYPTHRQAPLPKQAPQLRQPRR